MNRLLVFIFCFISFHLFSQLGPGSWKDHLSLNYCNSVAKLGSKIYASNVDGLMYFDEDEINPQPLNKINGLSDVQIRLLRTNPYNNKMLVIYNNSNIDVIDVNGTIKNYPDFKLKTLNGKKIINEVTFDKELAYLACGFGIVIFDTEKLEIKETLIIGANASQMEVYQLAINDSIIFAATPLGLYKANYKTTIINNYNNWRIDSVSLPKGPYVGIVKVLGKLLTCYAPSKLDENSKEQDTLYVLENNLWKKYPPTANVGNTIRKFGMVSGDLFSVVDQFGYLVRHFETAAPINYITSFNGEAMNIFDGYFGKDYSSNMSFWIADAINGLFQTYGYYPYMPQNKVKTNGINQFMVNSIDVFQGKLVISPSHPDDGGGTSFINQGINVLESGDWSYVPAFDLNNGLIQDITYSFIDRKDKTKIWASSWFSGLLQYKDNKLVKVYNSSNSPMPLAGDGAPRCTGIDMDKDGNVWFANSDTKNFLTVLKKDGSFVNFEFAEAKFIRKILVDKNNYVWILHERGGGLTVFKNDNFAQPAYYNADLPNSYFNCRLLSNTVNNGNLQDNSVFSIAEDNDGKIWVGTALGVSVFYSPSSIFSSTSFDSQPIKIVQDGNVELLLGKEVVTSIAIDGANNKWAGTQSGGLYCFSPDGITQLQHFTLNNSPIYSNYVVDVNYDEVTGDVFIGTDIGLQSYRSFVVKGQDQYSNVYAYPNPVRPNFTGNVFVTGLIDNSIVKIVDESGNLVWETKSKGGQIAWPVTTLSGNRVTSGVYVVYATSTDGEQRALTKVLVVN